MLLNRFWSGLRTQLKEAARSKTEHIHDFESSDKQAACSDEESLRDILTHINARLCDLEVAVKSSSANQSAHSQPQRNSSEHINYDRPTQTRYSSRYSTGQGRSRFNVRGQDHSCDSHTIHRGLQERHNYNGFRSSNPVYRNNNPVSVVYRGTSNNRPRNDFTNIAFQHRNPTHTWTPSGRSRLNGTPRPEIICHRCKQPGHIAAGCRVDLEALHLNLQGSA